MTTLAPPRARSVAAPAVVALAAILAGGLALRLWAFGGVSFAWLSDDSRYVAVAQNLAGGHLPSGTAEWFGTRIVFLWPVAALFRLFGASDGAAVAWPLAGSLLAVVAAYLLGRDLVSRRVGLIAAALVAAAPLEVLLATRLRPDAIMPGLVALAVWCALRARRSAVPLRWAAGAGLLLGAGWSVRESALVMAPIVLAAGWGAGRRALAAGAAGLAAVPLGAAAVFAAAGGSPLRPLLGAGEAGEWHDPIARWSLDGSYLAQAIRGAGRPGTLLFLALPVLAVAGVALLLRGDRRALLPAAWLALAGAYLEFGTLVNLDKPVRFLTLCTIPAALLVALALSPERGLRPAFAALVPAGVAVVAVMALAPLPGREHRADDVFLAGRVAGALRDLPRAPVLTESYTWWATFRAYLPAGRLAVPRAEDPAFLSPAQRRERRRMVPLPDPADYAGGYVVTGPVHPRAGWPSNWGAERRLIRREVPWSRLRPVARVGDATIWRWPA